MLKAGPSGFESDEQVQFGNFNNELEDSLDQGSSLDNKRRKTLAGASIQIESLDKTVVKGPSKTLNKVSTQPIKLKDQVVTQETISINEITEEPHEKNNCESEGADKPSSSCTSSQDLSETSKVQKDHDGTLSELQKMVEAAAERESFMDNKTNENTANMTANGKSNPFHKRISTMGDKLPMVTPPMNKKLNMLSGVQLSIDSQHKSGFYQDNSTLAGTQISFHPGPAKNSPTPRKLILMPHLVNKNKSSRTRNGSTKVSNSNMGIMYGESRFLDYTSSVDGVDSMAKLMRAEPYLNSPSAAMMPKISQKYINIDASNLHTEHTPKYNRLNQVSCDLPSGRTLGATNMVSPKSNVNPVATGKKSLHKPNMSQTIHAAPIMTGAGGAQDIINEAMQIGAKSYVKTPNARSKLSPFKAFEKGMEFKTNKDRKDLAAGRFNKPMKDQTPSINDAAIKDLINKFPVKKQGIEVERGAGPSLPMA